MPAKITERRAGRRGRHVRQHEREGRKRSQHRQRSACALDLKTLLVMAHASDEQAQADDAIARDHDGGKNGVTRQSRLAGGAGDHDGDD
jgi:hypothetical protein